MGKSKTGGTRGYIRGRIANDVYSIGKDGKGKKQQVIRSLAESVANPRTTAQMRGRMIMSTIMQAVAGFSAIIDHSFDGIAKGQPSISEFIRRNYALIKADVAAHPASGNAFGLLKYQEKRVAGGAYVVSDGAAFAPTQFTLPEEYGNLELATGKAAPTFADLKALWVAAGMEYLTLVGVDDGKAVFARLNLSTTVADETVLSSANIASCFDVDGNVVPRIQLTGDATKSVAFDFSDTQKSMGVIFSFAENGGYVHTPCTLYNNASDNYVADTALPTYPTGSEQFLNGGEI